MIQTSYFPEVQICTMISLEKTPRVKFEILSIKNCGIFLSGGV